MATNTNLWASIKDHPIVIVLGFCAATAASTAAIYEKFILPYYAKSLESQVFDLKKRISEFPNSAKIIAEKDTKIKSLEAEVLNLTQKTIALSGENVFSADDPYPKSFRPVRIGDLFSKVENTYPGKVEKLDPDNTYVSVKAPDFFFSSATYYYDESKKPFRVVQILFHLNAVERELGSPRYNSDSVQDIQTRIAEATKPFALALEKQLIERYGPGKDEKRGRSWVVRGVKLQLKDNRMLLVNKA